MLKAYKKFRSDDSELNELQENVQDVLTPVINSQVIDGVLLKNVVLDSTLNNIVEHRLGRAPEGWILVRKRAQSTIWDLQDSNVTPSRTLILKCSANVTVDLWVF